MATFRHVIVVDRPPDAVFELLADLENDPSWRREWVDARAETKGPARVGARTALVAQTLGRRVETVYEVTDLTPGRSIAWRAVSGPLPLAFSRAVQGVDGGTRITFVYELGDALLLRVLAPLLGWLGRRQLVGDLPVLRELLGASPSEG